jgi:RNA polymerase sigma-70 factor (ECF subfamily)
VSATAFDDGESGQLCLLSSVQPDLAVFDSAVVSDERLLEQVLDRDPAALRILYQRHGSAVFALAQYILRDGAVAEELTQEVFLTVWNKAFQYQAHQARFRTWLLSITRNRAIDQLRKRQRRIQADISLDDPTTAEEHATLTEPIDVQRELHLLLRHLPLEQRTAIELCYFGGFTHEEIAQRLGLPLGTVKSRILLGVRKLREMMKA